MNPPSFDIAAMIVDSSEGTLGTNLFVANLPDTPNLCTCIYDTGGFEIINPEHLSHELPTVQVIVRGLPSAYTTIWNKAKNVRNAILGYSNTVVNSTKYIGIFVLSDITFIKRDKRRRPLFSFNLRIIRSE